MKTKKVQYQIKVRGKPQTVEGASINLFVAARKITKYNKTLWVVDHLPTGSKIWICNNYTEARSVGEAFLKSCSNPQSSENSVIQKSTSQEFREFLKNNFPDINS